VIIIPLFCYISSHAFTGVLLEAGTQLPIVFDITITMSAVL